ncbi:MAG: hypothetical protein COV74_04765 [Candidatus Omnitrophica bacterium CG11_big_fil_rev_8_21_14_0_20_45_26]|uniref:Cyclic nucleotide-binding domain-containing protein n=1 Tax=Candidatus Abzuiibacterium crystallinum TaxID=1974748 RepID=A0A2H0LQ03_9BACT|nr:MAG: hypothetical protein COV74_04765 [Candidatus Omnitrophica bacterium CG11_big_fil_rev_8_21_14_0_20_45_26]PIW64194.1 MAG: hypothetical protein COW12_07280 [Candidatus Omnitrophica bacterium CG12_big_fil_rev_8_21_14_0_65_45_16]
MHRQKPLLRIIAFVITFAFTFVDTAGHAQIPLADISLSANTTGHLRPPAESYAIDQEPLVASLLHTAKQAQNVELVNPLHSELRDVKGFVGKLLGQLKDQTRNPDDMAKNPWRLIDYAQMAAAHDLDPSDVQQFLLSTGYFYVDGPTLRVKVSGTSAEDIEVIENHLAFNVFEIAAKHQNGIQQIETMAREWAESTRSELRAHAVVSGSKSGQRSELREKVKAAVENKRDFPTAAIFVVPGEQTKFERIPILFTEKQLEADVVHAINHSAVESKRAEAFRALIRLSANVKKKTRQDWRDWVQNGQRPRRRLPQSPEFFTGKRILFILADDAADNLRFNEQLLISSASPLNDAEKLILQGETDPVVISQKWLEAEGKFFSKSVAWSQIEDRSFAFFHSEMWKHDVEDETSVMHLHLKADAKAKSRVQRGLIFHGIMTIEQLIQLDENTLLSWQSFGPILLQILKQALAERGLSLASDRSELRLKPSVNYPVVTDENLGVQILLGAASNTLKDIFRERGNLQKDKTQIVILPPHLFDGKRSFGELEFMIYYNAYVRGNIFKADGDKVTVVGTKAQTKALQEYIGHTIFGPDWNDPKVYPWVTDTERALFKRLAQYYPPKRSDGTVRPLSDYVDFIVFNEKGQATVDVRDENKQFKGQILVEQQKDSKEREVVSYQLTKITSHDRKPLQTFPVRYDHPGPVLYDPPSPRTWEDIRSEIERGRYGFARTWIGTSNGFDPAGDTTSMILWLEGTGIWVDPSHEALEYMDKLHLDTADVPYVLLTHIHQDHDGGVLQRILMGKSITLIASRVVYEEFMKKAELFLKLMSSELDPKKLVKWQRLNPGTKGWKMKLPSGRAAKFRSWWNLHTIPTNGFSVTYAGFRYAHSGDTDDYHEAAKIFGEKLLDKNSRLLPNYRYRYWTKDGQPKFDFIDHEAGDIITHVKLTTLGNQYPEVLAKMAVYHVPDAKVDAFNQAQSDPRLRIRKARMFDTDVFVPSDEDRRDLHLVSILARNALLHDPDTRELFLQRAHQQAFKKGSQLTVEGEIVRIAATDGISTVYTEGPVEPSDRNRVYFIVGGRAAVWVGGKQVATLGPGMHFGDWAVLNSHQRRTATVQAIDDLTVYSLTPEDYLALFGDRKIRQRIAWLKANSVLLSQWVQKTTSHVFHDLNNFALDVLAGSAEERVYQPGETIIQQGEPGKEFFIIKEGTVVITSKQGEDETVLGRKTAADSFGEISILRQVPRTATVQAETLVRALVFKPKPFQEILKHYPLIKLSFEKSIEAMMRATVDRFWQHQSLIQKVIPTEPDFRLIVERMASEMSMSDVHHLLIETADYVEILDKSIQPQLIGIGFGFSSSGGVISDIKISPFGGAVDHFNVTPAGDISLAILRFNLKDDYSQALPEIHQLARIMKPDGLLHLISEKELPPPILQAFAEAGFSVQTLVAGHYELKKAEQINPEVMLALGDDPNSVFFGLSDDILRDIAARTFRIPSTAYQKPFLREGETVKSLKDFQPAIFVVTRGVIRVERKGKRPILVSAVPNVYGEIAFFTEKGERTATVRAESEKPEDTEVYAISKADAVFLLSKHPLLQLILSGLVDKRLTAAQNRASKALDDQLSQLPAQKGMDAFKTAFSSIENIRIMFDWNQTEPDKIGLFELLRRFITTYSDTDTNPQERARMRDAFVYFVYRSLLSEFEKAELAGILTIVLRRYRKIISPEVLPDVRSLFESVIRLTLSPEAKNDLNERERLSFDFYQTSWSQYLEHSAFAKYWRSQLKPRSELRAEPDWNGLSGEIAKPTSEELLNMKDVQNLWNEYLAYRLALLHSTVNEPEISRIHSEKGKIIRKLVEQFSDNKIWQHFMDQFELDDLMSAKLHVAQVGDNRFLQAPMKFDFASFLEKLSENSRAEAMFRRFVFDAFVPALEESDFDIDLEPVKLQTSSQLVEGDENDYERLFIKNWVADDNFDASFIALADGIPSLLEVILYLIELHFRRQLAFIHNLPNGDSSSPYPGFGYTELQRIKTGMPELTIAFRVRERSVDLKAFYMLDDIRKKWGEQVLSDIVTELKRVYAPGSKPYQILQEMLDKDDKQRLKVSRQTNNQAKDLANQISNLDDLIGMEFNVQVDLNGLREKGMSLDEGLQDLALQNLHAKVSHNLLDQVTVQEVGGERRQKASDRTIVTTAFRVVKRSELRDLSVEEALNLIEKDPDQITDGEINLALKVIYGVLNLNTPARERMVIRTRYLKSIVRLIESRLHRLPFSDPVFEMLRGWYSHGLRQLRELKLDDVGYDELGAPTEKDFVELAIETHYQLVPFEIVEQTPEFEQKIQAAVGRDFVLRFSFYGMSEFQRFHEKKEKILKRGDELINLLRRLKESYGDLTLPSVKGGAESPGALVRHFYGALSGREVQFDDASKPLPLTGFVFFYEFDTDAFRHEWIADDGRKRSIPTDMPVWPLDNGLLAVNLHRSLEDGGGFQSVDKLFQIIEQALRAGATRAELRQPTSKTNLMLKTLDATLAIGTAELTALNTVTANVQNAWRIDSSQNPISSRVHTNQTLPVTLILEKFNANFGYLSPEIINRIRYNRKTVFWVDGQVEREQLQKLIKGIPGAENVKFITSWDELVAILGAKQVLQVPHLQVVGLRGTHDEKLVNDLERVYGLNSDQLRKQFQLDMVSTANEAGSVFGFTVSDLIESLGNQWRSELRNAKSA